MSKKEHSQRIGYGTGRYILDLGLKYVGDYLSSMVSEDLKEVDDDKIFEPIWEYGVHGRMLSEPIFDIGTPTNWLHMMREFSSIGLLM